ncbi:hypothetical protein [Wenyingzhuangia sp. 2_MG-2023]|nr:hypothetical protein [Wenyingzhuangia sp. 2_MG-2023]MDO6736500.1 hypothetical protein [Wenyingzhuangia sp. 2_MG-2023]
MNNKENHIQSLVNNDVDLNLQSKDTKIKPLQFWVFKNSKPIINAGLLTDFLELNNFRTLSIKGYNETVKFENNIVTIYTPQQIYNFGLEYVKRQKNDILRNEYIKIVESIIVSKKATLGSLKTLELKPFKDTREVALICFKNGFTVVLNDTINFHNYSKLNKLIPGYFIYESQIIKRNYNKNTDYKQAQFYEFTKLITNSEKHFLNVVTALGYLLHKYKNPSIAKAIILSDILSQASNTAQGRSGKGILIQALHQFLNIAEYNGKNVDLSKDKFVFQSITLLTNLFLLQDVQQSFNFEDLFAVLTDKMSIERKHQVKIILDFIDSPKIALTTNYTINNTGGSFTDRKHLVFINNYFNSLHKPEQHFKNLFFSEWDHKEYECFDAFMIYCIQTYLNHGLVEYNSPELEKKSIENNTSKSFVNAMETHFNKTDEYYNIKELAKFVDEVVSMETRTKSKTIVKWLNVWATYKGLTLEKRLSSGITKFKLHLLKS